MGLVNSCVLRGVRVSVCEGQGLSSQSAWPYTLPLLCYEIRANCLAFLLQISHLCGCTHFTLWRWGCGKELTHISNLMLLSHERFPILPTQQLLSVPFSSTSSLLPMKKHPASTWDHTSLSAVVSTVQRPRYWNLLLLQLLPHHQL